MAFVHWRFCQALDVSAKPGTRAAASLVDRRRADGETVIVCAPMLYYPFLFHSHNRERVVMYDDDVITRKHYYGSAVLRDEDLIAKEELPLVAGPKAWIINMRGGGWGDYSVPTPTHWERVCEWSFSEVYGVQGDVVVVEYAVHQEQVNRPKALRRAETASCRCTRPTTSCATAWLP